MTPDIAAKVLRLALCPTAPDGEVVAAMRRLQAAVSKSASDPVRVLGRLLSGPATVTPDATINFGKYRGRLVSSIARTDPDYLFWAQANLKKCGQHLRKAMEHWVRRLEAGR